MQGRSFTQKRILKALKMNHKLKRPSAIKLVITKMIWVIENVFIYLCITGNNYQMKLFKIRKELIMLIMIRSHTDLPRATKK